MTEDTHMLELMQKVLDKLDRASQAPAPARQADQSETTAALSAALAKAQGAFSNPDRTKTAKVRGKLKDGTPYEYEYKYADLADILTVIRGPLSEAGLAITQDVRFDRGQEEAVVATTLRHSTGEWIRSVLRFPCAPGKIQELGSVFTYLRRYSLSGLIGIAPEEDDDGKAASNAEAGRQAKAERQADQGERQGNRPKGNPKDIATEEDLKAFWNEFGGVAPTRFASKEEAMAWVKEIEPNPAKAQVGKLKNILKRLEARPWLKQEGAATTAGQESDKEKKMRNAVQGRWVQEVEARLSKLSKDDAREVACWWAGQYHGWLSAPEPTKGADGFLHPARPQATLTPVAQVKAALDAWLKLSPDELDLLTDEYFAWITEEMVRLNPPADNPPEVVTE